jgi:hypothetical protein
VGSDLEGIDLAAQDRDLVPHYQISTSLKVSLRASNSFSFAVPLEPAFGEDALANATEGRRGTT